MAGRSKLDPNQISQFEHDEENCAKRVTIVNTEMAMELSADDGDSVQGQARVFEYQVISGEEFDITFCKELIIYCDESYTLEISPVPSGDRWSSKTSSSGESMLIFARRARITTSDDSSLVVLGRGL